MPQLDLITFFPQIFWCFILFFLFFFYFSFDIIPKITTVLKFRKKKLNLLANEINEKKDSSSNLLTEYDNIISTSFREIKSLVDKLFLVGNTWLPTANYKINSSILLPVNKRFLKGTFLTNYIFIKSVLCFQKKKK